MSSGVSDPGRVAALRAMAHPLRLRMLSMLTGTAMSAADVARELDLTHANASYHLRQMRDAGLLVVAEEESVRGGRAKRYRYDVDAPGATAEDPDDAPAYYQAVAGELVRRSTHWRPGARGTSSDAELWVDADVWDDAVRRVADAVSDLHRAARPPRSDDTVHVSITTALFLMGGDR